MDTACILHFAPPCSSIAVIFWGSCNTNWILFLCSSWEVAKQPCWEICYRRWNILGIVVIHVWLSFYFGFEYGDSRVSNRVIFQQPELLRTLCMYEYVRIFFCYWKSYKCGDHQMNLDGTEMKTALLFLELKLPAAKNLSQETTNRKLKSDGFNGHYWTWTCGCCRLMYFWHRKLLLQ